MRVLDPACGDGRFLFAVERRLAALGVAVELTGCEIDGVALAAIAGPVRTIEDDALAHDWAGETFDIVVGNPPFLSQMAAATTRGGASRHGGGPYADAAVEFLALAVRLARPDGGRVGLVLPQSIVGARDAAPVRADVARMADLTWSWWAPRQRHFDAAVNVCALGFARPATGELPPTRRGPVSSPTGSASPRWTETGWHAMARSGSGRSSTPTFVTSTTPSCPPCTRVATDRHW